MIILLLVQPFIINMCISLSLAVQSFVNLILGHFMEVYFRVVVAILSLQVFYDAHQFPIGGHSQSGNKQLRCLAMKVRVVCSIYPAQWTT